MWGVLPSQRSLGLPGERNVTTSRLRIGCCGFPQPLERHAQTFAVVEVQQTFYQLPLLRTLAKWRARVPDGFEFTLKAWQRALECAQSCPFCYVLFNNLSMLEDARRFMRLTREAA